jgi:hypothetical protein
VIGKKIAKSIELNSIQHLFFGETEITSGGVKLLLFDLFAEFHRP